MSERPPEPWLTFFRDLERGFDETVELHCLGGFAVIHGYGVARSTNDCDFVSLMPHFLWPRIAELGGRGSALHRRHKVYLDPVTVATPPDRYLERLTALFPGTWSRLNLYALEAHDLALAKLERNIERDRDDVIRLARAGHLDRQTLIDRYEVELRPYLTREQWHDQTLRMWIEACWEQRGE